MTEPTNVVTTEDAVELDERPRPTSFADLRVPELREAADYFAVDLPKRVTKDEIFIIFEQNDIKFSDYEKFFLTPAEVPEEEPKQTHASAQIYNDVTNFKAAGSDTVVLKLKGTNPRFEAFGYVFYRDNPFVAMPASDAQEIIDAWGKNKFELATPREVQEFYK
jgi:hypothetical protein